MLSVYFLYPETANVRLEDMDALFGDATTAMPTPAQEAEVDSLMGDIRSPVPSLDIRRPGTFTADNAIPGLNISPPMDGQDGKQETASKGEGLGGWISSMVQRMRGEGKDKGGGAGGGGGGGGSYGRLENEDD